MKSVQIRSYFCSAFPVFGLNGGKYGPDVTPYLDTFHSVVPQASGFTLYEQHFRRAHDIWSTWFDTLDESMISLTFLRQHQSILPKYNFPLIPVKVVIFFPTVLPVNICLFRVNNRNTGKRCEKCSKLTIKTPKRRWWRRSGVFIVNFKHNSYLFLVFLLLTLNK